MVYDIAIIGAGVCGCSIASRLSKYDLKMVIIDKESDVGCGTTKANTAIIHAGYDADCKSLKGKLNAKGNQMYDAFSKQLNIPFKRVGSLVLAYNDQELEIIKELKVNGEKLDIPGMKILSKEETLLKEPHINPAILGALWAPSAGIIEPWEVAVASCEHAMSNGTALALETPVRGIIKEEGYWMLNGEIKAKYIINAAGLYGDEVFKMACETSDFEIKPRRGQYYLFDKKQGKKVSSVVFQAPNEMGKGVVVAPTLHGNLIVGPDSEDLEVEDKEATQTTESRLKLVKERAKKTCLDLDFSSNITNFSGLRAEPSSRDFCIERASCGQWINVIGIKSPGLSSVPAIAEYVEHLLKEEGLDLKEKEEYIETRRKRPLFADLSKEEKKALIEKDHRYGKIICRCEEITEGEIIDAIHRPCGATTVNGVKRRVRPGSGRCQGGFCEPRVVEILARELKISPLEVKKEGQGSELLMGHLGEDSHV